MQSVLSTEKSDIHAANDMFEAVFERSLHFRIEMSYERACRFIRRIESYNDFEAVKVLAARLDRRDRRRLAATTTSRP
jgi:hypothetical protein